jgi:hypothetical protein
MKAVGPMVEQRRIVTGVTVDPPAGPDPIDPGRALRAEQVGAIYMELGRYIVAWSQLLFTIRTGLSGGYQGRGSPDVGALVAHLDDRHLIGAFIDATQRWVDHRHEVGVRRTFDDGGPDEITTEFEDDDHATQAECLRGWLHRLHDQRNRYLHDAWFVGWGNEQTTDWSSAELTSQVKGLTAKFDTSTIGAEKLQQASIEIRTASYTAQMFGMRARFGTEFMPMRFEIEKKRLWLVHPDGKHWEPLPIDDW